MKKIFTLSFLTLACILALVGCGKKEDTTKDSSSSSNLSFEEINIDFPVENVTYDNISADYPADAWINDVDNKYIGQGGIIFILTGNSDKFNEFVTIDLTSYRDSDDLSLEKIGKTTEKELKALYPEIKFLTSEVKSFGDKEIYFLQSEIPLDEDSVKELKASGIIDENAETTSNKNISVKFKVDKTVYYLTGTYLLDEDAPEVLKGLETLVQTFKVN